ncbi:translation factor [Lithospermum erythrorhizon]|uniref:Translation factor n=1 Tax=Lithospermum erythrorhizon TaxID=34254 RepID=A0AAV3Q9L1_LITER
MDVNFERLPIVLKPFLLSLFLCLSFLGFISLQSPLNSFKRTTIINNIDGIDGDHLSSNLKIRPGYSSYYVYIQGQLNKTLNPKLRETWTTRDWDRKDLIFSEFFERLKTRGILSNGSKELCVGARVGQVVAALKLVGVSDSVGIAFSNVFDHALYPWKFIGEIERTLKPRRVCILHVTLTRRADKYSANDLYSVKPLVKLFKRSKVVEVKKVDGFGLDTEVICKKNVP